MMELLFLNIGGTEMVVILMFLLVALIPLVLAIFALVDVFKRDFVNKSIDRLLIVLLLLFAPLVGSLVYFLALRKNYPLKNNPNFR